MEKGLFIVFEGIDGCGKSTQILKFTKYLSELSKYHHILLTRNPYQAREIREILRLNEPAEHKSEKLAELFVNDRKEHISDLVLPHLNKGHHVVCDRYKLSTIAYQSAQGLLMEQLIKMHDELPIPDITFIIDTPAEIAAERMKKDDRDEHKFESDLNFQKKVKENYLESINHHPNEKIIVIDGNKSIEEIFNKIVEEFEKLSLL